MLAASCEEACPDIWAQIPHIDVCILEVTIQILEESIYLSA